MKYSAVIRSLGNTDYLNPVIQSLLEQSKAPEEIVIVLPHNVILQDFNHADKCKIVESKKGMVTQRNVGLQSASCDYALLLDDDLLFTCKSSVEKLFQSLKQYDAKCSLPYYSDDNKEGFLYRLFEMFFLIAVPTRSNTLKYLRSGGYKYPLHPPINEPNITEGGRGACSAVNLKWLKERNIYMNPIFERVKYALRDDGAFIYDMVLNGGKAIIINGISIEHIGTQHQATTERLLNSSIATIYNNYLFWHEYILKRKPIKVLSLACFVHSIFGQIIMCFLKAIKNRQLASIKGIWIGLKMVFNEVKK